MGRWPPAAAALLWCSRSRLGHAVSWPSRGHDQRVVRASLHGHGMQVYRVHRTARIAIRIPTTGEATRSHPAAPPAGERAVQWELGPTLPWRSLARPRQSPLQGPGHAPRD
eukprot:364192-Chlamydomonas_euryale.AAC.9